MATLTELQQRIKDVQTQIAKMREQITELTKYQNDLMILETEALLEYDKSHDAKAEEEALGGSQELYDKTGTNKQWNSGDFLNDPIANKTHGEKGPLGDGTVGGNPVQTDAGE